MRTAFNTGSRCVRWRAKTLARAARSSKAMRSGTRRTVCRPPPPPFRPPALRRAAPFFQQWFSGDGVPRVAGPVPSCNKHHASMERATCSEQRRQRAIGRGGVRSLTRSPTGEGQFTHTLLRLGNRMPRWLVKLVPDSAMVRGARLSQCRLVHAVRSRVVRLRVVCLRVVRLRVVRCVLSVCPFACCPLHVACSCPTLQQYFATGDGAAYDTQCSEQTRQRTPATTDVRSACAALVSAAQSRGMRRVWPAARTYLLVARAPGPIPKSPDYSRRSRL